MSPEVQRELDQAAHRSIAVRKALTDKWEKSGVRKGEEYAL
jgi:hypothetical protein